MTTTETAPSWHKLAVAADGTVSVNGTPLDVEDAFTAALAQFTEEARTSGVDVLVHSTDEATSTAQWFTVDAEGQLQTATAPVEAAPSPAAAPIRPRTDRPRVVPATSTPPAPTAAPVVDAPVAAVPVAPAQPLAGPTSTEGLPTRKSLRDSSSFLEVQEHIAPARKGWRGRLNSSGVGFRLMPGQTELDERADEHLVARHYPGPRTIAVVNQKGGANKTPTVVDLAAVFGRAGLSVCAWDNNESTGTLGMRTERSDHGASALHVISHAEALLADTARAADIGGYVHRQTVDKFDVLLSDQDIDGEHEISAQDVDTIHAVLSRYYNLILVDTGNNHRAANWRRTIDLADQLVVPMTTAEDRVESARLTLQGLARKDERSEKLTQNAVVIISEEQRGTARAAQAAAAQFQEYVREVVVIPFDEALKGGVIRHDALQTATQRAWLAAAAAVAKGL